jgi:hypothetical protein
MKKITKKNIEDYLNEWHYCTTDELFNPQAKYFEQRHEILNDVFKEFSNHWIDFGGVLVTENPKNPIQMIYYHNYNNFLHINTVEDLIDDMKKAKENKKENFQEFDNRINEISQLRNKGNEQKKEK